MINNWQDFFSSFQTKTAKKTAFNLWTAGSSRWSHPVETAARFLLTSGAGDQRQQVVISRLLLPRAIIVSAYHHDHCGYHSKKHVRKGGG